VTDDRTDREDVAVDDAEDFAPSGADLVVTDPTDDVGVMLTLDKHDEAVIVAELQGRLSKAMLYDFPMGGKQLVDLSWPGVRECIHEMNRTGKCHVHVVKGSADFENVVEDVGEGPEPCVQVTLMVEDDVTGLVMYGTAIEPKRMKLTKKVAQYRRNDGKFVDDDDRIADPFARQKALGKAQRNAFKQFIPETLRQTLIAQYKGDAEALKKIHAGAGAEQLAELPAPLPGDDERANELRARAREVYAEIRELDPLKILPAAFNQMMIRHEHEYGRLEELIGTLEQRRDEAKEAAE
jgi:chorismate mutase